MPERIEKLVLWLVPALALQFVSYFIADGSSPDAAQTSGSLEGGSIVYVLMRSTIAPLLIYLPNVVTAVWMWQTESAFGGRTVRWTLASLLLSYFVLIPYIGMYILWRLERTDRQQVA